MDQTKHRVIFKQHPLLSNSIFRSMPLVVEILDDYHIYPKHSGRPAGANSVDKDQTTPTGASYLGQYIMFALAYLS